MGPVPDGEADPGDERPLGLMYWGAALRSDFRDYARLWTEARVGQVSAELALLAHELARVNAEQYARSGGCSAGFGSWWRWRRR